jgi:hypothetical protein
MLAGEYVSSGNLEFRVAEQKAAYYARAPKLLDRLREALRTRHYSRRTEQSYCQWVKRFIFFHNIRERDLAEEWGRVPLPGALDRKYTNAPKEWRWQWVFPLATPSGIPSPPTCSKAVTTSGRSRNS